MTVAQTFPDSITAPPGLSKTLQLAGHSDLEREIQGVPLKVLRKGAYFEADVVSHLQAWKGKSAEELLNDEAFIAALAKAPVEKFISIGFLLEQNPGSVFAAKAEPFIKQKLIKDNTLGEAEEKEIQALTAFFQSVENLAAIVSAYPSPSVVKITVSVPGGSTVSHESSNEIFVAALFETTIGNISAPVVEGIVSWLN